MVAISLRFVEKFISLPKKKHPLVVNGHHWARQAFDLEIIAPLLTRQGLEVEGSTEFGRNFDSVVVGRVEAVAPHPGADKLEVCQVNIGEGKLRQIVCGAPNVRKDLYVAVAIPGTKFEGEGGKRVEIKVSSIRNVESHGMLCSRSELGLPVKPDVDGDGLWEISVDAQCGRPAEVLKGLLGMPVFDALELRDVILEINVTANRPDARTHEGIARELEVGFKFGGIPFERKSLQLDSFVSEVQLVEDVARSAEIAAGPIRFSVDNELGVSAFFAVIENVKVRVSPGWMRSLLEALGQSSINNVVDASNFILLAFGQPSHAFDLDKICFCNPENTAKKLFLRMGEEGEKFLGLDGKERSVQRGDSVVADAAQVHALLGVIGGEHAKTDLSTKTIVVELANPHPVAVRRTSRRHGRATESAMSFEKGIDAAARFRAASELVSLIAATAAERPKYVGAVHSRLTGRSEEAKSFVSDAAMRATFGPALEAGIAVDFSAVVARRHVRENTVDRPGSLFSSDPWGRFGAALRSRHTFRLSSGAQTAIVGAELVPPEKASAIIESLGFQLIACGDNEFLVTSPHWRWLDVAGMSDLVEEIVRIVGIDSVPSIPLLSSGIVPRDDDHIPMLDKLSERAAALGYLEVAGFHFMRMDDLTKLGLASMSALGEPLVLLNPIIRDEPLMHTTLIPDLLRKVARNLAYGTKRGQLFHLCRTYQNSARSGGRAFSLQPDAAINPEIIGKPPARLDEYAPHMSLLYSLEKEQRHRPAETPRIAGVAFGERIPRSWQTREPIVWDLHTILAHVVEVAHAGGVELSWADMEGGHPFAPALHPGRRVSFFVKGVDGRVPIGWAAELHPRALRAFEVDAVCIAFELNLAVIHSGARQQRSTGARRPALQRRFPAVSRDFAFVVREETLAGEIERIVRGSLANVLGAQGVPARLTGVSIFDVYRGKGVGDGRKSVAFSINLEPTERTLVDSEIGKVSAAVVEAVKAELAGELRS